MIRIGLLIAMEKEALGIAQGLSNTYTEEYKGKTFTIGKVGEKEVVLALAGIGKVNSAYTTTLMIEHYNVECVINTGIAGGVGKLAPLTALSVSSVCQHDSDTTALGDPIGLISGLNKVYFDCDEEVVEVIRKATGNAVVGRVATGDRFVASDEESKNIAKTFDAVACDMECCACAQVCYISGVKFGALKVISDSAGDESPMDYATLAQKACEINANALLKVIKEL